jgi:RNA ligase
MVSLLEKYYEEGLLYKQVHPTLPLTIWNYSPKTQYENNWDYVTLMCRGLVTDNKGNVVARPFKKFFNQEEGKHTPTSDFDVYAKMDGSLGILFNYEGEWILATRGSFTSDQSIKGMEMLKKYYYETLHKGYTYLFEIIYSENRIVVQYPFEDVVLLGMINTKTGEEVDIHNGEVRFRNMISNVGFRVVEKYDGVKDYSLLKEMVGDNEEGFVVRFSNRGRMKVKGVEYLRLHKIMTNISTTTVWEVLANDGDMNEMLKDVPDEFYDKIKDYQTKLENNYNKVKSIADDLFKNLLEKNGGQTPERKLYAEWVKNQKPSYVHSLLFRLYDGRDNKDIIWKLIKPEFMKL